MPETALNTIHKYLGIIEFELDYLNHEIGSMKVLRRYLSHADSELDKEMDTDRASDSRSDKKQSRVKILVSNAFEVRRRTFYWGLRFL